MTDQELADLNEALLPFRELVTERDDGETYQLNRIVPAENISDPITFAATYGITVAP